MARVWTEEEKAAMRAFWACVPNPLLDYQVRALALSQKRDA